MINSLTARIFAIFWFTLALVLMLVLMVPKLDSRQMTSLLDSEQRQGLMLEQHVEAELQNDPANDLMWWRRLFRAIDKWAPPGQRLLLVTSEGRVIGALERMMNAQQRLISDISHELRTPLTRLQLATALMRRRHGEGHELARIETEAQRLDSMINDLLALSRGQQKSELAREQLKANELWADVLDNARFEAEQMGKQLEITAPPGPWTLFGNASALDSALENIVRNALRYSHTRIAVAFSADNQGVTIQVDDDGPGVSAEDREQIFRPFYRTDEARDRESGGTGLGLAIVEAAINQHRGWVKAEDSPLGGLRLVLWLPLHHQRLSTKTEQ
ncbi:Sensor protein CpxA [Serratia marcescens]|uniref:ATP-binding protein n=1 Tax=Serratia marcescens TaxID=615 RepID=UPI00074569D4|nr:ATP-binding protein [Serratia marcescens]CVH43545.1 Sensor protein CpxA [Serratia marcescens]